MLKEGGKEGRKEGKARKRKKIETKRNEELLKNLCEHFQDEQLLDRFVSLAAQRYERHVAAPGACGSGGARVKMTTMVMVVTKTMTVVVM